MTDDAVGSGGWGDDPIRSLQRRKVDDELINQKLSL